MTHSTCTSGWKATYICTSGRPNNKQRPVSVMLLYCMTSPYTVLAGQPLVINTSPWQCLYIHPTIQGTLTNKPLCSKGKGSTAAGPKGPHTLLPQLSTLALSLLLTDCKAFLSAEVSGRQVGMGRPCDRSTSFSSAVNCKSSCVNSLRGKGT